MKSAAKYVEKFKTRVTIPNAFVMPGEMYEEQPKSLVGFFPKFNTCSVADRCVWSNNQIKILLSEKQFFKYVKCLQILDQMAEDSN